MSEAFECWDIEDEDRVFKLSAYDARTAAELCAERIWDAVDGATGFEIDVRDKGGEVHSFVVDIEARPMFVARREHKRAPIPVQGTAK